MNFLTKDCKTITICFNAFAGYAITSEVVTEILNVDRGTGDHKEYTTAGSIEDTIISMYSGFCFSSPRTPLVGSGIDTLYLPPGRHTIVFYTYFSDFFIDLTVHVEATRCTGIINICETCSMTEAGC